MQAQPKLRDPPVHRTRFNARGAALAFVFVWFLLGGAAHFVFTDLEIRMVPPYRPWPREVVLATGGLELLGAAGLLFLATRRSAGLGLFALTVLVSPAHVYMLQRPELFDLPLWALWLRLPMQVTLLGLIAWGTGLTGWLRPEPLVTPNPLP